MTATISNIQYVGGQIVVSVHYTDISGFVADNQFSYPSDGTVIQTKVVADITAQGTIYKNNLAAFNTVLGKVGQQIII
jgi:hypothetical protein